ncbi:LOB domain-containing protein 15-like isoform X2 [Arachis stenosperma]|uniref:LOB domain-containing protein 15-like isoform X2 n=1 Tax=Arachis stenosperma TaxID=217475 RepID=UPI0025AD8233|nr:LOB domain-containing protein 15-like isoform X2 [Arachis stenosperma]
MFGCPETDEIAKKVKKEGELLLSSSCSESEIEIMGRKQSLNTVTPCAACKLLRRRCAEECPFSPYFSPHEPQKFAAVHKVFGASNVSKMLMEVGEGQRADAANSLVYEANLRLRDPVYGCMGAISGLQQQIQTLQAEVNAVRAEILKYKYREAAATATATLISMNHHHHHHLPSNNNNNQAPIIINNNNDNNAANSSSQQQGISQPPPLPPPPLRPAPPNPSLPSPSTVVLSSSLSSSSASSVYNNTPPKTTLSHGSITSESVPYFA